MRGFADRADAGRELAARLNGLRGQDLVVLGLPRGGVPVAAEVARELEAPLDIIVVRKLGLPRQPEVAMGAIGEGGARVINTQVASYAGAGELAAVEEVERAELARRVSMWRAGRDNAPIAGRIAVVVDDGIATGATAAAACQVARLQGAMKVILAVPVAPADAVAGLKLVADEVVVLLMPHQFNAVGQWYADFSPTQDAEVTRLLLASPPC